jgi:hypothetical protein
MPLSWCSPRSSNAVADPATRWTTVRVTSTSPGGAVSTRDARGARRCQRARCPVVRPHRCGSRTGPQCRSGGRRRGWRCRNGWPGRTVEGGEDAATRELLLMAREPRQLVADALVRTSAAGSTKSRTLPIRALVGGREPNPGRANSGAAGDSRARHCGFSTRLACHLTNETANQFVGAMRCSERQKFCPWTCGPS